MRGPAARLAPQDSWLKCFAHYVCPCACFFCACEATPSPSSSSSAASSSSKEAAPGDVELTIMNTGSASASSSSSFSSSSCWHTGVCAHCCAPVSFVRDESDPPYAMCGHCAHHSPIAQHAWFRFRMFCYDLIGHRFWDRLVTYVIVINAIVLMLPYWQEVGFARAHVHSHATSTSHYLTRLLPPPRTRSPCYYCYVFLRLTYGLLFYALCSVLFVC